MNVWRRRFRLRDEELLGMATGLPSEYVTVPFTTPYRNRNV